MSSTESPRLRDPTDVALNKLCKKGATFTRAKQYLDEIQTFLLENGTESMPDGVVSLCAFIASEQCVYPSLCPRRYTHLIAQARE